MGVEQKNNITGVLQKIFIDEFAVIATLTGREKNISVALGSSEIIKLVKSNLVYIICKSIIILR